VRIIRGVWVVASALGAAMLGAGAAAGSELASSCSVGAPCRSIHHSHVPKTGKATSHGHQGKSRLGSAKGETGWAGVAGVLPGLAAGLLAVAGVNSGTFVAQTGFPIHGDRLPWAGVAAARVVVARSPR
jgi:hypothetical protein